MKPNLYLLICFLLAIVGCSKEEPDNFYAGGNGDPLWSYQYRYVKFYNVKVYPTQSQSFSLVKYWSPIDLNLSEMRIEQTSTQLNYYPVGSLIFWNDTLMFTNQSAGFTGFQIDSVADTLRLVHIRTNEVVDTWSY